MEHISERTWIVVGAVMGGGFLVVLVCLLALPFHAQGVMLVSFSDASRTVPHVSEISVEVVGVELHRPHEGWVSVVSAPRMYNLFSLKRSGAMELAGQSALPVGVYTEVRVTLGSVLVHTTDGASHSAVLGSRTYTIAANTVVGKGHASHINIDINAASSLHVAEDGTYVFVPVVAFQSAEGIIAHMGDDGSVVVSGGTVDSKLVLGSDLSGRTYHNLSLAPNVPLAIQDDAPVVVASAQGQGTEPGSVEDTSLVQIGQGGMPKE